MVGATKNAIEQVVETAKAADDLIGPALSSSIIPAINVAADVIVVSTAVHHNFSISMKLLANLLPADSRGCVGGS